MSKSREPYRFIISGGGTGGHIYPAIAIAHELRGQFPDCDILFVGDKSRMEMEKVPREGFPIVGLWISGIQRKITLKNLMFPIKLGVSLLTCWKIIRRFKPHAAIGVGGYASAPLLYVASQLKVPTVIQEQNSYAGLTNKWLARRVNKICVAYPEMDRYFPAEKLVMTGNPVRKDIISLPPVSDSRKSLNLDPAKKVLLVLGGSLGARTINESIRETYRSILENEVQLVWQSGKLYLEALQAQIPATKGMLLTDFIYEMDKAYGAADVVISRAGALTLSELALAGKAAILVPSPNVAEDHQTRNARALVKEEAAILVPDEKAEQELAQTALDLLADDSRRLNLERNIKKFARPDAAQLIVKEIKQLLS